MTKWIVLKKSDEPSEMNHRKLQGAEKSFKNVKIDAKSATEEFSIARQHFLIMKIRMINHSICLFVMRKCFGKILPVLCLFKMKKKWRECHIVPPLQDGIVKDDLVLVRKITKAMILFFKKAKKIIIVLIKC